MVTLRQGRDLHPGITRRATNKRPFYFHVFRAFVCGTYTPLWLQGQPVPLITVVAAYVAL